MEKKQIIQANFTDAAKKLLKLALEEDIGAEDISTSAVIPETACGKAVILSKSRGVFCGTPVVAEIYRLLDPELKIQTLVSEGSWVARGKKVISLEGRVRSILKGERVALNFLGLLSAVATKTREFADKIKKDSVILLDTRKTLPLLREFQKYAVRVGGGRNHRMGLYDAILIKENHRIHGDLQKLKSRAGKFEIEVRNKKELKEALKLSPRVILFDNFKPSDLREAIRYAREKNPEVILEASGGMTLENITHYSALGIDWISVGALTHSIEGTDYSLLMLKS